MPHEAEQLSRVMEFSVHTEHPLWILVLAIFPSTIAFKLKYMLSI